MTLEDAVKYVEECVGPLDGKLFPVSNGAVYFLGRKGDTIIGVEISRGPPPRVSVVVQEGDQVAVYEKATSECPQNPEELMTYIAGIQKSRELWRCNAPAATFANGTMYEGLRKAVSSRFSSQKQASSQGK